MLSADLVADIAPGSEGSYASEVYEVGGLNLFAATDGQHGRELWRTDGTPAGTRMVKDLIPGAKSTNPYSFVTFNDAAYFLADNALWRTDGTAQGTAIVQDDPSVRYFGSPRSLTAFNGALYFWDTHAVTGAARLWRSDGTPNGLSRVLPFQLPKASDSKATSELTAFGDALVFSHARALWRTDGTQAGTAQVADVAVSGPLQRVGDALIFMGEAKGRTGVWRTDGTSAGTWLVGDLHAGSPPTSGAAGAVHGRTLYFAAGDGVHGTELWKTDGTAAGTAMVADIYPPASTLAISATVAKRLSIRDVIAWPDPGYSSDSVFIGNPTSRIGSEPANFNVAGNYVVFTAHTRSDGVQLFRTDGTAAGTVRLGTFAQSKNTYGYGGTSNPFHEFQSVGGTVFFPTRSFSGDSRDLFLTDGTLAGTRRVWTREWAAAGDYGPGIQNLSAVNGSLFFAGQTYPFGLELMRWDHTGGITGVAYDDANGNGVRDPSELPLPGWRVFLDRNGDGVFNRGEKFTFADAGGAYGFPAYPDGDYTIRVTAADGWTTAATSAPVQRGRTTWRDVGAARVTPVYGSIAGNVFKDADFDGALHDDKGEHGFEGVRVYLDLNHNGYYTPGEQHAFTDADGDYRIEDVLPGRYRAAVVDLGPGHEYTRGLDATVVVLPGTTQHADFGIGYDGANGVIRGTIFDDRNDNGTHDRDETGIAGHVVYVDANRNRRLDPGERSTVTDMTGYFAFRGLRRGTRYVRQVASPPGDWVATTDGVFVTTLSPGGEAGAAFGYRVQGTASVWGYVFADADWDGAWGPGEVGAWNWWVYADLNRDGVHDASEPGAWTNPNTGAYKIRDLLSGTYLIRFDPNADDWQFTHGSSAVEVHVKPGQARRVNAGAIPMTSLTGRILYDRWGDRVLAGDPGQPGVTVYLDLNHNSVYDAAVDRTTVTDAQGVYRFDNVRPGTYYAVPVAPSGWAITSGIRNANAQSGHANWFPAMSVSDRLTVRGKLFYDFNLDRQETWGESSITDYMVYADLDNDRTMDEGEPRAVTNSLGSFTLRGIPIGSHVLRTFPRENQHKYAGELTVNVWLNDLKETAPLFVIFPAYYDT